MTITVAVTGATGRLGSLVCELIEAHPGFTLDAKLTSTSGVDEGATAAILFDASNPASSPEIVERALRRGQRVIVATSGWSAERLDGLRALVTELPGAGVLVVPNFSLGSVLGTVLASIAAPHFESVEIIEAHHAGKVDSPSGTAVRTAELIAEAREGARSSATSTDQPARGQLIAGVPVHSLRMQGVVAEQQVRFGGEGEELVIEHVTHSSASYRAGVLAALDAISSIDGVVVGLENVLEL